MVDVMRVAPMSLQVAERAERPEIAERPEQPEAAQAPTAQGPTAPAAPPAPATTVGAETPAPGRIIVNGKELSVDGASDIAVLTGSGVPFPPDIPPGVQNVAETAIVSLAMMIAAFPVFGFLKALVNRRAAQPALPSRDTTDRLQRIEAAVEAMSVEVERISEGQRFVTKVLAERSSSST